MKNIPCYDVPHGTLDLILQGEMQHIQRALRLVIRSHKCYCRMVCYPTVCVIHGTNQTIQSKLIQNKDWGCASNAWRLTGRDLNSLIKIKTVFQTNLIINCTIFAKPKVMLSRMFYNIDILLVLLWKSADKSAGYTLASFHSAPEFEH